MLNERLFLYGCELPPRLLDEETYRLFLEFKEGSMEAREILITHNIGLVIYEVIHKFCNFDYDKKELVCVGNIGLIKAVDSYDILRGVEFATYAVKCIDNEILMFLKKCKRNQCVNSFDSVIFRGSDGNEMKLEDILCDDSDVIEDYEKKEIYIAIRCVIKELPKREKEIAILYFGFDNNLTYSQKQIADIFGIDQSRVSKIIKKVVNKVRNYLIDGSFIGFCEESNRKRKSRKILTIYEYLDEYTKEQVDVMLTMLSEEERDLITLKYEDNSITSKLTLKQSRKFYGSLTRKMRRLLVKLYGEPQNKCEIQKDNLVTSEQQCQEDVARRKLLQ